MMTPLDGRDTRYERLLMFTDSVFAIAITLLVLEIPIPKVQNESELGAAIVGLLPQIFVFGLSFIQVGLTWLAHTRMFRLIERGDNVLMVSSLFYLMLVAFLPVPSATLARYGNRQEAVIFFAVTMLLLALLEFGVWQYVTRNPALLKPGVTVLQIREVRWRNYNVILIFLGSIIIAFISPLFAMLSWLLLFITRLWIRQHFERLAAASGAEEAPVPDA